ncbi:MAG: rhodanese-like domain-containing protein [Promethearchaeota archaeon]
MEVIIKFLKSNRLLVIVFIPIIILVIIMAGIYFYQLRDQSEPLPLLPVVNHDDFIPDEPAFNPPEINHEIDEGIAILFDVRTEEERNTDGYAVGSTHFDIKRLESGELPDNSKEKIIYIYCRSGGRAEKAKEILEANGFQNVINIGGLVDWQNAGGKVISGQD